MMSGFGRELKQFIWRFFTRPSLRFFARLTCRDAWRRFEPFETNTDRLPSAEFFRAYCLRESSVEMQSVDDFCAWLVDCEYEMSETYPIYQNDWPKPGDFEATRRGNCVDHALWAWRSLNRIGITAELVWGQCRDGDEVFQFQSGEKLFQGHAWVQFNHEGMDYLFDSVMKEKDQLIRPLTDVRIFYLPWFSVDSEFRRYYFWGYLCHVLGLPPTG